MVVLRLRLSILAENPERQRGNTERPFFILALSLDFVLRFALGLEDDSKQSEESRSGWFEGVMSAVEPKGQGFLAANV
jgi:hypothetical protein